MITTIKKYRTREGRTVRIYSVNRIASPVSASSSRKAKTYDPLPHSP